MFIKKSAFRSGKRAAILAACLLSATAFHNSSLASSQSRVEMFLEAFKPYFLNFDIDAASVGEVSPQRTPKGIQELANKIKAIMERDEEIEFICLAFPFKSSNHDKNTSGDLPDIAERYSLEYLNQMIDSLKKIYPKVRITIFTDGLLFSDLFGISDATVLMYEKELLKMAHDLPNVAFYTFSRALKEKGVLLEDLKKRAEVMSLSKDSNPVMTKRIENEITHSLNPYFKMSAQEKTHYLLELTKTLLKRDQVLRNFMKQFETKNTLSLSIHYQDDLSKKIGIKLTPTSKIFPWNGVLMQQSGRQDEIVPLSIAASQWRNR